ncbi:Pycsar system effector family protein [Oryzifoliimicrobium ureilyticus]|uniref:Pycsar system effector family protein n=1 Tax=Oryzifoliimicrobium ureilyticus TaxID=3113724 RepID=UPI0030766694
MTDFSQSDELMVSEPTKAGINSAYFDHIKKINDVFYDQIKLSDQKAAYIFTFMLAFLVSSSEGRAVFTVNRYLGATAQGMVLSAILATASILCILAAILVVLPRHVSKSTSLFWGAWPKLRQGFLDAAYNADRDYLFSQYVDNADILSGIARSKYRCVVFAFRALMVTVVSYVLLLVLI